MSTEPNRPRILGSLQTLDLSSPASGLSLLRRFTLLSLGTTLAVGVLFGTLTARLVEDFGLRRQAQATATRVLEVSSERLVLQDFRLPPAARRTQYEVAVQHLIGKIGITHVTVWNRQGELLYSDAGWSPGGAVPPPPLLSAALEGQLQWQRPGAGPGEHSTSPQLEVFIPVVAAGIPRPVAVYQVRSDLTDLAPALTRLKWSVEVSVVLGVLFLYVALFSIVRTASRDLGRQQAELQSTFLGIIRSLVTALDARDMATGQHSSHVGENAMAIARAMKLSGTALKEVQVAGFLHDIGKIGIPDGILTKQGPLTPDEWAIMKRHTVYGYDILGPVPMAEGIKLAVRHSHERWDGRGYPDGLAGTQIPLAARVVFVADAFEAMRTDRPYRLAMSFETAIEEIKRCAGTQFDPEVVDAFLQVVGDRAPAGERTQAAASPGDVRRPKISSGVAS